MPSKPKLSAEDQILYRLSTLPLHDAEQFAQRVRAIVAQKRRDSRPRTVAPKRRPKVNAVDRETSEHTVA